MKTKTLILTAHAASGAPEDESAARGMAVPSPRPNVSGRSCPEPSGRATPDQIRSRRICPASERGRFKESLRDAFTVNLPMRQKHASPHDGGQQ